MGPLLRAGRNEMLSLRGSGLQDKRVQYAILALLLCGILSAAWFGYTVYRAHAERSAYKDLAESIDGYAKVRGSVAKDEKWADVGAAFKVAAARHGSSHLHPYFLFYEADALLQQGKQKDALVLMQKGLAEVPKNQPLYYLYALKQALLKIDAEETASQGRQELDLLARDSANPVQDMARYYRAVDAELRGESAEAEKLFQELRTQGDPSSSWVHLAQNRRAAE